MFRFNAIHIAAKSGHADVIKLIISHLESPEFWARIYPSADVHTAEERRLRVLDLYLNSPETGVSFFLLLIDSLPFEYR